MLVLLWLFYISTVYYTKSSGEGSKYQLSLVKNKTNKQTNPKHKTKKKNDLRWESLNVASLEIIIFNSHMSCLLVFQAVLSYLATKAPEQFNHFMKTGVSMLIFTLFLHS